MWGFTLHARRLWSCAQKPPQLCYSNTDVFGHLRQLEVHLYLNFRCHVLTRMSFIRIISKNLLAAVLKHQWHYWPTIPMWICVAIYYIFRNDTIVIRFFSWIKMGGVQSEYGPKDVFKICKCQYVLEQQLYAITIRLHVAVPPGCNSETTTLTQHITPMLRWRHHPTAAPGRYKWVVFAPQIGRQKDVISVYAYWYVCLFICIQVPWNAVGIRGLQQFAFRRDSTHADIQFTHSERDVLYANLREPPSAEAAQCSAVCSGKMGGAGESWYI